MTTLLGHAKKIKQQHLPKFRRGISPIVATIIIVAVGLISLMSLGVVYNSSVSGNKIFTTVQYISATSLISDEVENAKWEILFLVKNSGTGDLLLEKLSVSKIPVLEYGVSSGGELSGTLMIGSSVPEGGLVVGPGETYIISIWVGSELFSTGSTVTIELLNISSAVIPISVTLV